MFRADRIGTPWIHNETATFSSLTTALTSVAYQAALQPSVINATPLSLFDRVDLRWNSATAKSVAAFQKSGLVAQVTVPKPVAGNVVGIEIAATLVLPATLVAVPFITELTSAPAAILAVATTNGSVTNFLQPQTFQPAQATALGLSVWGFKEQVLLRDITNGSPEGLYAFGFQLYNPTAAALTFTDFEMVASVRQKMDQPGIAYEDTRR